MTNIDKLTTYQHWWHSVVTSCDQLTTSCNQLRKTGCNWLNCTQLNCCNWFLAVELSCWGSQHSQQPVAVAVDQTFGQQLDPTGPQITIIDFFLNCRVNILPQVADPIKCRRMAWPRGKTDLHHGPRIIQLQMVVFEKSKEAKEQATYTGG